MSSALFRAVHRGSLSRYTPHSTARRALAHRCFSAQTESNNRRGKGTEMPSPDKGTVIQRLQDLLRQAQNFDKLDPDFYRSADFENWKSEVDRWLRAGSPYTDDQSADFLSVRFVEIGWYSDRPQVEFWRNALKRAQHLLNQAIENIQQDWMISNGSAGTATNLAPGGTTIVNMNIQLTSLNVRTVLEEIAGAIEAKDKAEGANFKEKIEKWAENPVIKRFSKRH